MTYRLLPLLLAGCAFPSREAHEDRVRALSEADTDTDTDSDTDADTDTDTDTDPPGAAPQVTEVGWRFRFSGFNLYQGLQLAVQVTDADGDIEALVIQGLEEVPWSQATQRADDWYLVPIALDLGAPCDLFHDQTIVVFLRDAAGLTSNPRSVQIRWDGYLHDESGITSSDQCEPCVRGLTTDDLPIAVCGIKDSVTYSDNYDAVQIVAPGGWGEIRATVNYGLDAQDLRFGLVYPPDYNFVQLRQGPNDIGYSIVTAAPADATVHEYEVSAESPFYSGSWTMFFEPAPPPALQ